MNKQKLTTNPEAPATVWRIPLPHDKPPLSLNDRMHWGERSRIVKQLRHDTALLARSQRIPECQHITVTLHYIPKQNRRIDADNRVATSKPCVDGLVDAGIVPDDNPRFVNHRMPVIHPADKNARTRLWIEVHPS